VPITITSVKILGTIYYSINSAINLSFFDEITSFFAIYVSNFAILGFWGSLFVVIVIVFNWAMDWVD